MDIAGTSGANPFSTDDWDASAGGMAAGLLLSSTCSSAGRTTTGKGTMGKGKREKTLPPSNDDSVVGMDRGISRAASSLAITPFPSIKVAKSPPELLPAAIGSRMSDCIEILPAGMDARVTPP